MRVGFIGVGKMGGPMALRLAGAGHQVQIFDASQEAVAALAGTEGIAVAPSPQAVVQGAEAVITMLPDGKIVRAIAEQIAPAMEPDAVLVDMSTSYPLETTDLRTVLRDDLGLVDAPVSGGVWRAEIGTLTIMAGGADQDVARVSEMLEAMGNPVRCGALGAGHAMKLLNNYLSASGLAATCEALMIGQAFGLDPSTMADVFNGSTGKNNATEVKLTQHLANDAFASGFTMGLMAKDLTLGRKLAGDLDVPATGLDATQALYERAAGVLGASADHTEVLRILRGH